MDIDVNRMLEDVPIFAEDVRKRLNDSTDDAIDAAAMHSEVPQGPVTYPFTTEWRVSRASSYESPNWFYATGSFSYAIGGTVTVYPPESPDAEWRTDVEYQVHVADRYNWDRGKFVDIGPFHVEDKELQELHKAGIAQEYDLTGVSNVRSLP